MESANNFHDPYSALRLRDFRLYVSASLTAVVSGQIENVALQYELYQRTRDPMALAWLGLIQFVPTLALGLLAGQAADWFDRKRILVVAQAVAMCGAFGLAALSRQMGPLFEKMPLVPYTDNTILLMYLCVLLRSTAGVFIRPARQALLPQIVSGPAFGNAITWSSSIFQLAFVIGPALAGQLIPLGLPIAYLADGGCCLLSVCLLTFIRRRPQALPSEAASLETLIAGFRFVWRTKVILAALTLDLFAVLLGGVTALLPIYASEILHVDARGLGWLRSAPAVGAICMALVLAHLPPMKRAGRAMLVSVAGFGIATVVFGLSTSFWLSLAMLFLTGALDNISVVVRHSMVQLLSPDRMRGRVSAVNSMFIGASNQLGEFESGLVAKWWGPVGSAVAGGVGTVVVVIAAAILWPQVRRIGALSDIKPVETEADES